MKRPVQVAVATRIAPPDGRVREIRHGYDGIWFCRADDHYLVYLDEGVHTTVRWNEGEVRLYRRNDQIESYQVFRQDWRHDFELRMPGNRLQLCCLTRELSVRTDDRGGQVSLAYSLECGPSSLGDFTLTIAMAVR